MNFLKTFSLLFGCLFLTFGATAQIETIDVVYLKDGTILKGTIKEYVPQQQLIIELTGGQTFTVKDDEIKKIVQESTTRKVEKIRPKLEKVVIPLQTTGLTIQPSLNLNFGENANNSAASSPGFSLITCYQKSPFVGYGAGVNFDNYVPSNMERILSFYGTYRILFDKKLEGMYAMMSLGYGLPVKSSVIPVKEAQGGFMVNPQIGWRLPLKNKLEFTIDAGVRFQDARWVTTNDFGNEFDKTVLYNRYVLRMGLQFWTVKDKGIKKKRK